MTYMTQKEVCEYLNVTRMTLLRWEAAGVLSPERTMGKHRRYPKEEVEKVFKKPKKEGVCVYFF